MIESTRRELAFLCLYSQLAAARPPQMDVLATLWEMRASFNVEPEPDVRPDIVVAPRLESVDDNPPGPPLLVVELLSWHNDLMELGTRMRVYEEFGVRNYWLVDPVEPTLIAYELDDQGRYGRTAKIVGDEPFETTAPFPVRIVLTEPLGTDPKRTVP